MEAEQALAGRSGAAAAVRWGGYAGLGGRELLNKPGLPVVHYWVGAATPSTWIVGSSTTAL